jgi:DNA-binding beta-propeller fold protein YncE
MTIDEGLNRVYATISPPTGPGHVAVIDATSGRLIRTVTVGRYPGQVIASARTGHAFVVNGQDGTVSMLDGQCGHVLRTIGVRPAQHFSASHLRLSTFRTSSSSALSWWRWLR